VSLVTIGLLFVLFVLALIPAMRLWTGGVALWTRVAYLVTLLLFGLLTIEVRPLARFLLPIGLLLYLLPFSGLPDRWTRWRRRDTRGERSPEAGTRGTAQSASARAGSAFGRFARGARRDETIIEGTAVRLDESEGSEPPR
jgi:hypothetical protein